MNGDGSASGEGERCPRCRLKPVADDSVFKAAKFSDPCDTNGSVWFYRNDCAHLLQHGNEVENLGFDCRIRQFGVAFGEHRREEELFGSADTGEGEFYTCAAHAIDVQLDDVLAVHIASAKGPQHIEMEIDRAWSDRTTAGSSDDGVTRAMK